MQVAGRCAEVAGERSWNDMFAEYIKQPLSLTRTTYASSSQSNPRIAGGVTSCAADMLRLACFIRSFGRVGNTQLIDSAIMEELWKDQTNSVLQLGSPYPYRPANNNPYRIDTIRYGIGTWLDIYNPVQNYQEQISGAGAFGAEIWVNRCNNTAGALFTMSLYAKTQKTTFKMLDLFNAIYPNQCYQSHTSGETKRTAGSERLKVIGSQLHYYLSSESSYHLTMYGIDGKVLWRQSGTGHKGVNVTDINFKKGSTGISILRLESQGVKSAIRLLSGY